MVVVNQRSETDPETEKVSFDELGGFPPIAEEAENERADRDGLNESGPFHRDVSGHGSRPRSLIRETQPKNKREDISKSFMLSKLRKFVPRRTRG
jgi:hypothetical protein